MRRIIGWLLGGGWVLFLFTLAGSGLARLEGHVLAQAQATATPRPDGSIVHTVQEGDTLFGLALLYGTTVEEIKALNGLQSDLLAVGQELVIRPPQTPAPTPTTVAGPGDRGPAVLCTGAFEDRNRDDAKADGEPWIAGVPIYLINGRGWKATLISEAGQAVCARDLEPGAYFLTLESPTGYQPSGPTRREVWLSWNTEATVLFGFQPLSASTAPTPTPISAPAASTGVDLTRLGEGLALGAGFLALLLVGVAVGYFVGQRSARSR